jgi:hypothetical protein
VDDDKCSQKEKDNDDCQPLCDDNQPISILSKHIAKALAAANREGGRENDKKY